MPTTVVNQSGGGGGPFPDTGDHGLAKEIGFSYASDAAFDALDCNTLASGDVDVKVLASIESERISLTPDTPTVAELAPSLDVALWNGLFVHADTPQDVQDKIIAVAEKTMMSDPDKPLIGMMSLGTSALKYVIPLKPAPEERGFEVAVFHAKGRGHSLVSSIFARRS